MSIYDIGRVIERGGQFYVDWGTRESGPYDSKVEAETAAKGTLAVLRHAIRPDDYDYDEETR